MLYEAFRAAGAESAERKPWALKAEVQEALEQRKEQAVCTGEEAATKLLVPMILMLIVVMVLILVPAGMSMMM